MNDCAAPRHDGQNKPTPAAPAAHLCHGCTANLREDLENIPAWFRAMEQLLDPRRPGDTRGGSGDGLFINAHAAEWRDQAGHDLAWWVQHVMDDRHPDVHPERTVPAMAGWLAGQVTGHRGCLSLRHWAGDMAGTFADDQHRAQRILYPRRPPITVAAEKNRCRACEAEGTLIVVLPQGRMPRIRCTGCGQERFLSDLERIGYITELQAQAVA